MEDEEKRAVSTVWKFWDLKKKKTGFIFCIFPDFHCGWSYT